MDRFDIVFARIEWHNCPDERPWLIVHVCDAGKNYLGFPISGEHYSDECFELDPAHADFAATGLTKRCYIFDRSLYEIEDDSIRTRRGCLTGSLLHEFLEYSGL